jgi:hypothetical protein
MRKKDEEWIKDYEENYAEWLDEQNENSKTTDQTYFVLVNQTRQTIKKD